MAPYGTSGPQLQLDDIQGDVVVGLQKDFEWFLFFVIEDAGKFKQFARLNLVPRITSAAQVLKQEHEVEAHKAAGHQSKLPLLGLNIGFTCEGLRKLEVPGVDEIKDEAFVEGLAARSHLLNDPQGGEYSPRQWKVGEQGNTLDGVILITGPSQTSVDEIKEQLTDLAAASGWRPIHPECGMTRPNNRGYEHFGFLDGISQPLIRDEQLTGNGSTWAGEFVFGYPSQYANDPEYPGNLVSGGPDWTTNGSLMVVRRLVQFVPEFDAFIEAAANELNMDRDLFAARLVGRWKSGAPLSITPLLDDPLLGADDRRNNNFDFANDQQGRRCPFASHIRRAYPRDDVTNIPAAREAQTQVDKRKVSTYDTYTHRVMRRGIPFGPELSSKERASGETDERNERGLMFVCYQTSIKRQFEFVVRNFINDDPDPKFPPARNQRLDALVGQERAQNNTRRVEGLPLSYPSGDPHQIISLATFVSPTGGGYFFVPSLRAFEEFVAVPNQRQKKGAKMPSFNQKDIEATFEEAQRLFNDGDYEGLRPLMHPAIVWKLLHHAGGYSTADAVINFLNANKKKLQPRFDPNPKTTNLSQQNSDGSQRYSGTAAWRGSKDSNPEDIQYIFTFQQDTAGRWLLVDVFGHLIDRKLAQALENAGGK